MNQNLVLSQRHIHSFLGIACHQIGRRLMLFSSLFFLFFFSKWDLIVLSTRLNLLDIKWDLIFSMFFPGFWIFYVLWTFYFLKSFKILKLVFLGFSNIAKWWVRENMNIQGKMDALIQFFFITLSTLMIKLIIRVY